MNINRLTIKQQAKNIIQASKPNVISVGAVFLALSVIIGWLSSRLLGVSLTQEQLQRYMNYVLEEDYNSAIELLRGITPPAAPAYLIDTALQLMLIIVSVGFIIFLLNTIRKADPCLGNLLDGFGIVWRIIVLYFLKWLFITLWTMLLIVPGIIAAYRYRQAVYILIDHPELSPLQCISASKAMMAGHKMELFELDLSFIGWAILCYLPIVGYLVQVWVAPYYGTVKALYYTALCQSGATAYGVPPDFEQ